MAGYLRYTYKEEYSSSGLIVKRSGSGPGDGQTHQSVKVSLYFFDIAYVTPHHLPFRDIEDDMASIACPFMLQYGQLPLNSTLYR